MPRVGDHRYLTVQSDYHRVQIPIDDIMYVTIDGRKTKITRKDGSAVRTNKSLRDVFADLPGEVFQNINRGIVVSKTYIKSDEAGLIIMRDGSQFKRRVRSDRGREKPKVIPTAQAEPWRSCPAEDLDWWLGKLPLPMCILELVYRGRGGATAFVVRWCNREMEQLEGVSLREVKDQPVTLLRGVGDSKWLTVFADVAINGGSRTIEDLWAGTGRFLRLHVYQPQAGCCGLVLTDLTRENNLVQKLIHQSANR